MRSMRQARLDAEQGARDAHPGKRVAFGEPAADGPYVRVPYAAGSERGESVASTADDSGAVQVFESSRDGPLMGFLGFGKDRVVDPYGTAGTPARRPARRLAPPPLADEYTPDRVELVADLGTAPLERVARGYGLTLEAAARFRDRLEVAESDSGTRGFRASAECDDILTDRRNRKRW